MNKTRIILVLFCISLLVLTACSGSFPFSQNINSNNQNRDYYVGTDGVVMRFSDSTTPPSRMYYYEGDNIDDNSFQILIDVQNIGSSWTKGALYISGYDPYMIQIDNIDIAREGSESFLSSCLFNVNFLGGGNSQSSANCQNFDLDLGGGGWGFGSNNLGTLLDTFNIDASFLDGVGISVDTYGDVDIGVTTNNLDLDTFNHGVALLLWAEGAGLNLMRYNGLNYAGEPAGAGILEPDYPQYPGGQMNTVNFPGVIRNWPQGLDRTDKPITFLVTNCFLYSTVATPQVCIDPAPFDQGIKVCQPQSTTYNGGNGAPVAISTIEQENSLRKVFFEINVRNVGGGTIFDAGAMESCSPYSPTRLTTQQLNKVYILDARIGNQQLDCTPDRGDGVRMIDGRGTFRCEYDIEYASAKSAYETPLIIELGYGYSTTMRRTTTIKRVV